MNTYVLLNLKFREYSGLIFFLSDSLNLANENRELRVPTDINPCLSDQ